MCRKMQLDIFVWISTGSPSPSAVNRANTGVHTCFGQGRMSGENHPLFTCRLRSFEKGLRLFLHIFLRLLRFFFLHRFENKALFSTRLMLYFACSPDKKLEGDKHIPSFYFILSFHFTVWLLSSGHSCGELHGWLLQRSSSCSSYTVSSF